MNHPVKKSRTQNALKNVCASFIELSVLLISGFLIPRMVIFHYGSAYNGLVASISKFVSLISVLSVGISGAARAMLYGPLARQDTLSIASVVGTLERTYKKIGLCLLLFVVLLSALYQILFCPEYNYVFIASLVLIVSLTSFAQYVLRAPYEILLYADQKHSIVSYNNTIFVLLSSIAMAILILFGKSILLVRLSNSLIISIGALSIYLIARRRYNLTPAVMNHARRSGLQPIPDRKYAMAQGISDYINANIDVIVITIALSVTDVAVYAVYSAVTAACMKLIVSLISSFGAAFGNMYANQESDTMRENFKIYECIVFSFCSTVLATATAVIVPFVQVYTSGINDADYNQPIFALLLTLSTLFMCFRIPYETVLKSAGYFKQTNKGAYIEAGLNLAISIVGIVFWGLPGVALGTLVSASLRTFELAWHLSKKLIIRPYSIFISHVVESITVLMIACILRCAMFESISCWGEWFIAACVILGITTLLTAAWTFVRYRSVVISLVYKLRRV